MNWTVFFAVAVALVLAILAGWRELDRRTDDSVWQELAKSAHSERAVFDPSVLRGLPEPAQRYFNYSIQPGTVLQPVVELDMEGEIGLGTRDNPGYRSMVANQLLAPPAGLVWKVRAGPLSGSDAVTPQRSWTRFWVANIVPVIRAGNNEDHRRSAFGRVVVEGAFWAPSSLLPGESVTWTALGDDSARATVEFAGFSQSVDISVSRDGRPTRVTIQRWSNENAEQIFREQPFGGDLSGFKEFGGYRLPTVVEGGNHIGTSDYFPFFRAKVTAIRFPGENQRAVN